MQCRWIKGFYDPGAPYQIAGLHLCLDHSRFQMLKIWMFRKATCRSVADESGRLRVQYLEIIFNCLVIGSDRVWYRVAAYH